MTSRKKKVLFLTRYSRKGASSRLRSYQYLPFLEGQGWEVTISPLFNEQHLIGLYAGKGISWTNVILCYLNRFFQIFKLYRYDRIVIEKELFPFLPAWAEWWISRSGKNYLVDYDDAVFHNYDLHPTLWIRLMLKNKISKVMRYSQKVMVGNSYLADKARQAGAREILVLPTVVDSVKYFPRPSFNPDSVVKIGWIGSPTTMKYLGQLLPVMEKLKETHEFELVIIGGGTSIGFSGIETLVDWSEEREVEEIQKLDIGIMPLSKTSWERGKCGYKLIQYMACGLPVVGSPVGVNKELIIHGGNGFLPDNEWEWERYLSQLIINRELRTQMGKEGYKIVQEKYTLQFVSPIYFKALV